MSRVRGEASPKTQALALDLARTVSGVLAAQLVGEGTPQQGRTQVVG
ncbi:MAG: hypothetical protein ACREQM_13265 [Candidatus Dormibacteraceae bacterium]